MNRRDERKTGSRVFLRMAWRTVAQAAMGIGAAFAAALVVLITSNRGDALASLALVLAILAFVIQIMVFISDLFSSSRRDREAYEIYADTRALLSSIEARTTATSDVLNQQMNKMIDRFMLNAKTVVEESEAEGDPGNSAAQLQQDLVSELRRTFEEVRAEGSRESSRPTQGGRSRAASDGLVLARRWPNSSIVERLVEDGLNDLSKAGRSALKTLATDYVWSLENGFTPGISAKGEDLKRGLIDLRNLGFVREDRSTLNLHELTSRGRAAARLFNARGDIPSHVSDLVPWLKDDKS